MATEMILGERVQRGDEDYYQAAFFFVLDDTKLKTVDGDAASANVVPSPSNRLPPWARFSAAQKAALDAGEAIWEGSARTHLQIHPGDTTAALLARLQSTYDAWVGAIQSRYDARYVRLGTIVNAT